VTTTKRAALPVLPKRLFNDGACFNDRNWEWK
jgi:hypothetical protein